MLLYPNVLFRDRKIRTVGTVISALIISGITIFVAINPTRYSTKILYTVNGQGITDENQSSLAEGKYGDVRIEYVEQAAAYAVHADFKKKGKTS